MRAMLVLAVLAVAVPSHADELTGVVVDATERGLPDAEVRVVGETFIVTTRTDHRGQFRVTGLPAGTYRVEVEGGTVQPGLPPPIRIDRDHIRCCVCAMSRSFERAIGEESRPGRGLVDTRSTALGIVINAPGRSTRGLSRAR